MSKNQNELMEHSTVRQFVLYATEDESLPLLLRRASDQIDQLTDATILSVLVDQELQADDLPWKVIVYWSHDSDDN